jgi:DNA-damage-inducible protein D
MKKDFQNSLAIFETYKIRRAYDEQKEVWYFSVIDIIAALTGQADFKRQKVIGLHLKIA